ncbi:helix-turn-helix transcriptional regulator [Thalassovita aquimarina]|uniref:Helix-turn-helix transcriptional regulator n=1 Tax=Thalassovita aquimarina TaxID=2785917 RepID=A0ABS5HT48_9RHOB|nr:helix-turn-helix transcriptional regulator [Thalassovita aquimarina]MBR9652085.1 helix-turn-helix transcriptional regulator [Thalassovita aquimarina]
MEHVLKTYLAGQLRSFRKEAKLTQEELGARVERTSEAISNIERAKSLPTIETLMALSEALDRPLREFFPAGKIEDKVSPNRLKLEAEAATLLRSLKDDQLRIAIRQIEALKEG